MFVHSMLYYECSFDSNGVCDSDYNLIALFVVENNLFFFYSYI